MKKVIIALLMCISCNVHLQGQTAAPDNAIVTANPLSAAQIAQVSEDMTEYISEVMEIEDRIASATPSDIIDMERQLEALDTKWQAYTQIEQVDIAASPALMDILAQYKMVYVTTSDSLTAQKARLTAMETFRKCAAFISQSLSKYHNMESQAVKFSLLKQTATQLADVKAQEAILLQQVTENFQNANAAAQQSAEAKARLPKLQQQYVEITTISAKIQEAAYKPWIDRIKDYVLTFAGVAIILFFLNFIITKLQALKQARDLAKKYKNMINPNEDYPTI